MRPILPPPKGAQTSSSACREADILVNNLGIFEPKPFEDIPDADWLRFFETNVMSGIRMSRAYIPGMKAKDWGRIVFISIGIRASTSRWR